MTKTQLSKKRLAFCLLLFLFSFFHVQAQSLTDAQKAVQLIKQNLAASGLTETDLQNSRVSDTYLDKLSGATLVYLQQTYGGIDVDKHIRVLAFKNDKVMSAMGERYNISSVRQSASLTTTPKISASEAVRASAKHLNLVMSSLVIPLSAKYDAVRETNFGNVRNVANDVTAKLIWVTSDQQNAVTYSSDQKEAFKHQQPLLNKPFLTGIKLCWAVEIRPVGSDDAWRVKVDAQTGEVIGKENYTMTCKWGEVKADKKPIYTVNNLSANFNKYNKTAAFGAAGADDINSATYRVVKFPAPSPNFPGGEPSLHKNPWELAGVNNPATTLKWNYDGVNIYDSTKGNNVYAQLNWDDPESLDTITTGAVHSLTPLPDLSFDYKPDFSKQPTDSANTQFAVTNLFYWNNIVHDISYQYGFDEVSGNFQQNNMGRGGADSDYIVAFAQDGKGKDQYINNADFTRARDGKKGRMRMFLFSPSGVNIGPSLFVNTPKSFAGGKQSLEGSIVGTNNKLSKTGPVTGDVVLYNDEGDTTHLGCGAASNAASLKGKIALIDRGICLFPAKIANAQAAGAIGVIIINNVPNGGIITMGGTNYADTIPAVMITYETGDSIKTLLRSGIVNATLKDAGGIGLDGDVDATVITHEYTHGISTRLTGGPKSGAACLNNPENMGEGWSDYNALMLTTDWKTATVNDGAKPHPIGTYVYGQPANGAGIRTYPYSTDTTIDKLTYATLVTNPETHFVGEIWCTMLWDMTWNIIQMDGIINTNIYDANAAGGNSVALKLVYEGMKLQPCYPGFIDGRNAILKADTLLYNGKYSCAIWKAFTGRGLGVSASQGSSLTVGDEVAGFSTTGLLITKSTEDSVIEGQPFTYNISVKAVAVCVAPATVSGIVVDTLAPNISYVPGSGGTYNEANRTVTFNNVSLPTGDSTLLTFKAIPNKGTGFNGGTIIYIDNPKKEDIGELWKTGPARHKWTVETEQGFGNYYSGDTSGRSINYLTTKSAYIIPGIQTTFQFFHGGISDGTHTGGIVEISDDNEATWQDLGPYMISGGYNATIPDTVNSPIAGRRAFSGPGYWILFSTIDLNSFAGKTVKIRFRWATADNSDSAATQSGVTGWQLYIIYFHAKALIYNTAKCYDTAGKLYSVSTISTTINPGVLPVSWLSFTATKVNSSALLQWSTAAETNTLRFEVERSLDGGVTFSSLGTLAAAGNTGSQSNYRFTDEHPATGTNIYRIKQVDRDGSFDYSAYRPLFFEAKNLFSVTPNPAKERVQIRAKGNTKLLHISIMSSIGQKLSSFVMTGETKDLNLANLAAGVYHVVIRDGISGGMVYQQKVVIQQ